MAVKLADTFRSAVGRVYWASPHFLAHVAGKVVILMYHRVLPPADLASMWVQPGMYVTPETFERHLQFLTTHFEVLPFGELLAKWDTGDWNETTRYCAVTFDDGWIDNYQYAYPLLRRYGVPATIFLPTGLTGTGDWLWSDRLGDLLYARRRGTFEEWDALIERAKQLSEEDREQLLGTIAAEAGGTAPPAMRRFVNWDEVAEMSRHGIAFGSHSISHANLTRLSAAALERELRGSLETLGRPGVNHVPVLAYPNGDHTDAVVSAARAAGYRAAVTVRRGLESCVPADRFRLRRIAVHEDVSRSASTLALHIGRQSLSASV
jgi:peptidoglycan/xylan/chitin deacetylase (PgdA/CDA1 family)